LLALISLGVSSKAEVHLPQGPTQAWFSWKAAMINQGKVLLGVGQEDRALVLSVDQDQDDQVEQALKEGADPDATGDSGSSVLMLAAGRGKLSTVEILLQHGADVNFADQTSVNERGDTALLRAAYFGEAAMFERLLKAGARVDVVNRWDWTPVHMAAMGGCIPCLETLRSRGLSLNARAQASRGESPLMLAASRGQVNAMAWLLAQGAEPLQTDSHGYNALGWARFFKARSGPSEGWLLEHVPALAQAPKAP
jgi:ankyrin repeat protein